MAKRPVLVVHQLFTLHGAHVPRGTVISDPDDMAFAQKHHPEKVTRTLHEVADDPAPVVAPWEDAPVAADEPQNG